MNHSKSFESFEILSKTGIKVHVTFQDDAFLFGIGDEVIRIAHASFCEDDAWLDMNGIFGLRASFWEPIQHPVLRELLHDYSHTHFLQDANYINHVHYVFLYMYCEQQPMLDVIMKTEMYLISSRDHHYELWLDSDNNTRSFFHNGLFGVMIDHKMHDLNHLVQCHHRSKLWHKAIVDIKNLAELDEENVSSWFNLPPSDIISLMVLKEFSSWTFDDIHKYVHDLYKDNEIQETVILI